MPVHLAISFRHGRFVVYTEMRRRTHAMLPSDRSRLHPLSLPYRPPYYAKEQMSALRALLECSSHYRIDLALRLANASGECRPFDHSIPNAIMLSRLLLPTTPSNPPT